MHVFYSSSWLSTFTETGLLLTVSSLLLILNWFSEFKISSIHLFASAVSLSYEATRLSLASPSFENLKKEQFV